MNDEIPKHEEGAVEGPKRRLPRGVPEPIEAVVFAVQERVIWPLEDHFGHLGPGPSRTTLLGGGAAAVFLAGVAVVLALSSGGGGGEPTTTVIEAAAPQREPQVAAAPEPAKQTEPQPPRETLHGATPVFSPPSPASKGGEKTGGSKAAAAGTTSGEGAGSNGSSAGGAAGASPDAGTAASESGAAASESGAAKATDASSSPSPADATISSDPSKPAEAAAANPGTAARAVPDGPPAGPAALKVAREFAQGFVVYETGGEASAFKSAFTASATPELKRALLQRPPKQPAGVKVPRARVLNVVAGPSQGNVYKVSVSLLRVGVTSELRLDMEKVKKGKRVEWRVTNVLG